MTFTTEILVGMLDSEIERTIERLRQSRREMKADIAALQAEIERRKTRRA
jgi:uncharacterized small protein (DUF1192 family)